MDWREYIAKNHFLLAVFFILSFIFALLCGYFAHCLLEKYCFLKQARRFCRKHGFEPERWVYGIAFEPSGVKTEYYLFLISCLNKNKRRRMVQLLVSPFGVKAIEVRKADWEGFPILFNGPMSRALAGNCRQFDLHQGLYKIYDPETALFK